MYQIMRFEPLIIGHIDADGQIRYTFKAEADEQYQRWLTAGNTPLPPDPEPVLPPPPPTLAERLEAAEALIDMMLEAGGETSNG